MKALLLCMLALSALSLAFAVDTLVVATFGGQGYIDQFANSKGYFASKNLAISYVTVAGSVDQFDRLDAGSVDVASTTGDNVIYRQLNLGLTHYVVVSESAEATGIAVVANRNLGISSIQDLEGKTFITDSTLSGFIIPGKKIFKDEGVPLPDSLLQFVGVTGNRVALVANGLANATMSSGVGTLASLALNPQLINLGSFEDYVCPYLGSTLVATESWLASSTNRNKLVRYLKAQLRAQDYILNPAHQAEIISFIKNTAPGINDSVATQIYQKGVISPDTGYNIHMVPRMRGIINGVTLRTNDLHVSRGTCLPITAELVSQPNGWIDLQYLSQAAGEEIGFWNVYGTYYNYPRSPCEL